MIDNLNIKVYNSLTDTLEDFKTIKENEVTMYVCGPTVYNHQHIGNARPVIFFDTVKRFLKYCGFKVTHVSNFTDIDDKIIKAAKAEGVDERVISERYIKAFIEANEVLNCEMDVIRPKVTENIQGIIDFIDALVKNGSAYISGDDVYFRVSSDDKYGVLSNQKLDEVEVGARIDVNTGKEDPRDFTLWKKTSDDGIKFDSPFGAGRPGWHTECVVMINKIVGPLIDIHGGGIDLKFPHHENEIAQSCVLNNSMLANYWLHNARLDLRGVKMSKSLGNVIWIKDIVSEYNPMALRMLILSNHYRQTISYSEDLMNQMEGEVAKISNAYTSLQRKLELAKVSLDSGKPLDLMNEFIKQMSQDFNTSNAITVMYDLIKLVNKDLRSKDTTTERYSDLYRTFTDMLYILGIKVDVELLKEDEIELVNNWYLARANKDFELADKLRQEITSKNIKL